MSSTTKQYLRLYAEPEHHIASALSGPFGHCVAVPLCAEDMPTVERLLQSVPRGPAGDTLAILVINGRGEANAAVHERNTATAQGIRQMFGRPESQDGDPVPWECFGTPFGKLLLIDRFSIPFRLPHKQGVGLARKIGADIALAAWHRGTLLTPWIHSTDADVWLPQAYFAASATPGTAALVYPFTHRAESGLEAAMQAYELGLRYYVCGLAFAGSPYAFHTIGSTLAFHAESYAAVRGVPKRLAAEDFYLLNKLAKVGAVRCLREPRITIAGRASQRTPFGTGMALARLHDSEAPSNPPVYSPRVFEVLQRIKHIAAELLAHASPPNNARMVQLLDQLPGEEAALCSVAMAAFSGLEMLQRAHQQSASVARRQRFFATWLDGFRTLKLVHWLRDHGLPNVPLLTAVETARFGPENDRHSLAAWAAVEHTLPAVRGLDS